ncbi:hypothetical protein [Streptomyces scabiei]|uniref:hypothetical protein n=1 Tax=Streptomyces scabiei TaxID=1930 RepID=UPI00350E4854
MVTSNLPFGRWGETFSDDVVVAAAAMIDRLATTPRCSPSPTTPAAPAGDANSSPRRTARAATDQPTGGHVSRTPRGSRFRNR